MDTPITEVIIPTPAVVYTFKVWHSETTPGKYSFSITDHNNQPVESKHSPPDNHHKYGQFDTIGLALVQAINELLIS